MRLVVDHIRGGVVVATLLSACASPGGETSIDGSSHMDGGSHEDGGAHKDGASQEDGPKDADVSTLDDAPWMNNPDGGCPVWPVYSGDEPAVDFSSASAKVVDLAAAPVANVHVIVCGINICPGPANTSSSGAVTVTASDFDSGLSFSLLKPMFEYGDSLTWPLLMVPVTMSTSDLGTLVTAEFPATGAALRSGSDATSGAVTVSVPAGGVVGIDALVYDTPSEQVLRAVEIPVARLTAIPGVAGNGLALLYGTTPLETTFCPAAKMTVKNGLGWSPGAAVEFFILGDDPGQLWAPWGGWAKISDGAVSSDGTAISTVDGQGFPVLETFGIRLKR